MGRPSGGERGSRLEQAPDRGDRDRHPVGAMTDLVAKLADGPLELEQAQKMLRARKPAWNDARTLVAGEVAGEEPLARALFPVCGRFDTRLEPGRRRGVRKRAKHRRDVAERRLLATALGDRPPDLTREVDEEPVVPGPRDCAQVVVAVEPDVASAAGHPRELAELVANALAVAGDRRERLVVGQVREQVAD